MENRGVVGITPRVVVELGGPVGDCGGYLQL